MRFVITGEWTRNELLKLVVFFFLLYISAFWVTSLLLFVHKMGFSYTSVVEHYLGSESRYLQARSYQGLLEISHFHLFSMGILMLTLTHLILFVPLTQSTKFIFIVTSFSSAFLEELSGWLVRYLHPCFAWLKLGSFVVLQLSILVLIALVIHALYTKQPSAYDNNVCPVRG